MGLQNKSCQTVIFPAVVEIVGGIFWREIKKSFYKEKPPYSEMKVFPSL